MPYDVLVQLQPRPKLHSQTSFSVRRKQCTQGVVKLNGYVIKLVALLRSTPHTCRPAVAIMAGIVFVQSSKYDLRILKKQITSWWHPIGRSKREMQTFGREQEKLSMCSIHSIPFYELLSSMLWAQGGTMSRGAINRVRPIRDWAYSVRTGSQFAVLQYGSGLRYLSW